MLTSSPHRRWNPLREEWVLVSPHRTDRPWQGQQEKPAAIPSQDYDPDCYLCPGNARAGGVRNPKYESTFVFVNDFAALQPDVPEESFEEGLLRARSERGICKVICFSPDHSLTLSRMAPDAIGKVINAWQKQFEELGALDWIRSVQIFENRGAMMGASNPHPHCQIWATEHLQNEHVVEQRTQRSYFEVNRRTLLGDYLLQEIEAKERIVCENGSFVALVPYWAVWPFETMIVPRRPFACITDFKGREARNFADILKRVTTRYDNLFSTLFPYTMGFHQASTDGADHPYHHFHAHFYPPLLRSATVRKFMVGFEMLASPQRDITAETAADRLRAQSEVHFSEAATEG